MTDEFTLERGRTRANKNDESWTNQTTSRRTSRRTRQVGLERSKTRQRLSSGHIRRNCQVRIRVDGLEASSNSGPKREREKREREGEQSEQERVELERVTELTNTNLPNSKSPKNKAKRRRARRPGKNHEQHSPCSHPSTRPQTYAATSQDRVLPPHTS